jgi:hypothetical protein
VILLNLRYTLIDLFCTRIHLGSVMKISVVRIAGWMGLVTLALFLFDSCDFRETGSSNDSVSFDDQNFNVLKEPQSFAFKDGLGKKAVTVFGETLELEKLVVPFYIPDSLISGDNSRPDYIVTGAQLIHGAFFSERGSCEERTLLLCTRGDVNEEYYDLFFLARDASGKIVVSGKEVFDGSHGVNATGLEVDELPLVVERDCSVLMITSDGEVSSPDFHKESWVEIFMATGKGFRSLFRLQLEEVSIDDYVASEEETQRSTSKTQKFDILKTSTNGLYDLKVTYSVVQDGRMIREGSEVYRFDGTYYVGDSKFN